MTAGRQALFWSSGLVVVLAATYLLADIMLPFVAGMAVAYFLDPAVDRIEAWGASRTLSTALVTGLFFLIVILLLVLLVPLLQNQLVAFLENLPDYTRRLAGLTAPLWELLAPIVERVQSHLTPEQVERLRGAAGDYAGQIVQWLVSLVRGLLGRGVAVLNLLSLLFITPVVAFYLLRDWDRVVAKVDGWLPRPHAETIRQQLRLIDRTLAGFVRGQATVCLMLGTFYGVGLTAVGLNFGLIIGLVTGIVSFVPFFGMLLGFVVGMAMALAQFGFDPLRLGLVVAVFAAGQVIEGNFLTPRIVGQRIGLHPVWVIFALLAAGLLYGFVGILLAVPAAAVIGVLVRFALARYLASPLFLGAAVGEAAPGPAEDAETGPAGQP
jgi:predicted PurR-regulated permease PerM